MTFEGLQSDINGALDGGLTFAARIRLHRSGDDRRHRGHRPDPCRPSAVQPATPSRSRSTSPRSPSTGRARRRRSPFRGAALGRAELDGGGGADLVTRPRAERHSGRGRDRRGRGEDLLGEHGRHFSRHPVSTARISTAPASSSSSPPPRRQRPARALTAPGTWQSTRRRGACTGPMHSVTNANDGISYVSLDNITMGGRVSTGTLTSATRARPRARPRERPGLLDKHLGDTGHLLRAPASDNGNHGELGELQHHRQPWVSTDPRGSRWTSRPTPTGSTGPTARGPRGGRGSATPIRRPPRDARPDGTTAITGQSTASARTPGAVCGPRRSTRRPTGSTGRTRQLTRSPTRTWTAPAAAPTWRRDRRLPTAADGVTILKDPEPVSPPAVSGTTTVGSTLTCNAAASWAADAPNAGLYRMPASTVVRVDEGRQHDRRGDRLDPHPGLRRRVPLRAARRRTSPGRTRRRARPPERRRRARHRWWRRRRWQRRRGGGGGGDTTPARQRLRLRQDGGATKKNGTAKVPVDVPGAGELELSGQGHQDRLEQGRRRRGHRGPSRSSPNGKTKKKLKKKGKAKVTVEITFTPAGGEPNTEHRI